MPRGVLGAVFGNVSGVGGAFFEAFGLIFRRWDHLGSVLGRLGGPLGHLRDFLARLGGIFGRLGGVLGGLGAVLGRLGVVLRPSWGGPRRLLGSPWGCLGGSGRRPTRLLWISGGFLGPFSLKYEKYTKT